MATRKYKVKSAKRLAAFLIASVLLSVFSTLALISLIAALCTPHSEKLASLDVDNEKSEKDFAVALQPTPLAQDDEFLTLVNWENPVTHAQDIVPAQSVITSENVIIEGDKYINKTAGEAASKMFDAAAIAGIGPFVLNSAYRSEEEQKIIWEYNINRNPNYGNDPYENPVKAMPENKSEHTTGLAMDILSKAHPYANEKYANTEEALWLVQNAHIYGFVLRYPEGKQHITGIVYEPWHFRYVGTKSANDMYESGLCLEEYVAQNAGQ